MIRRWHVTLLRKPTTAMSSFRIIAAAARRASPSKALGRRGYAEVADKIQLSFVLPHQVRILPCLYALSSTHCCIRQFSPTKTSSKSTSLRKLVTWVSWPTTSPPSKLCDLALWKSLKPQEAHKSSSVRKLTLHFIL